MLPQGNHATRTDVSYRRRAIRASRPTSRLAGFPPGSHGYPGSLTSHRQRGRQAARYLTQTPRNTRGGKNTVCRSVNTVCVYTNHPTIALGERPSVSTEQCRQLFRHHRDRREHSIHTFETCLQHCFKIFLFTECVGGSASNSSLFLESFTVSLSEVEVR